MPLPVTFASLPEGDNPATLLDDQFTALSNFVLIPCVAVGTNTVQLTPYGDAPDVTAYTDLTPVFTWVQPNTCSGNVTLNVMLPSGGATGLGAYPAYKANGGVLVESGDLVQGLVYQAQFFSGLNAGSGGFVVNVMSSGTPVPPVPPNPGNKFGNGIVGMPSRTIIFTTSGLYTPATGITSIEVVCIGGGGAGGYASGSISGLHGSAGGGGSGAKTRSILLPTQIGTSQPVTIGAGGIGTTTSATAGGTTSFGTLVTAPGGQPGGVAQTGTGGAGGSPGTGDVTLPGAAGGSGQGALVNVNSEYLAWGGNGGQIAGGDAPRVQVLASSVTSAPSVPGGAGAPNTGAGGNGGVTIIQQAAASDAAGGNGGSGICIITEYQPATA